MQKDAVALRFSLLNKMDPVESWAYSMGGSTSKMNITINRDWEPCVDIGNFPLNVETTLWTWQEEHFLHFGVSLTNGAYIYVRVEDDEDFLIVPVSDEEGLDFFKPLALRTRRTPEDFNPDEGLFDLADEI